jgi:hypothetical protein
MISLEVFPVFQCLNWVIVLILDARKNIKIWRWGSYYPLIINYIYGY